MVKIIILAIILRLFMLGSVPPSLNWDEVSQGYTAYSLSQTGADEWGEKLPLFFRSYGEWKSAVYIYLLIPFIKILGLNAWSIRLPAAIAGIFSVYLIYLLGDKLYSRRIGLWAAFLMAVTPWSFVLGRPAFEANVALTLMLAGVYFFLKINEKNTSYSIPYTLYSAICFGLAPQTYNSAKVVVPLLVLYLVLTTKLYKNIKSTLLFFGILAVFAFPVLANLYSGHAQARYSQVGITTDQKALTSFYTLRWSMPLPDIFKKVLINNGTFFAYHLTNNFLTYLSPGFLFWHGGDHTQQSLPYHGVLYLTEYFLVIIGLYTLFHKPHNPVSINHLPLAIIIIGIIPAAMTRDPEHVLRSLLSIPGFVLLAALGIEHLQTVKFPYLKIVNWLLVIEIVVFMAIYFLWYPRAYARDWQYGYPQVTQYLNDHAGEYDQVVMTKWFGEPQLFLAFYGQWDPLWYQKENKINLRYETEGKMWLDQLEEYSLGPYIFKYLNWPTENRSKKTLYIGKYDDFDPATKFEETIKYPDGTVAFYIVKGDK